MLKSIQKRDPLVIKRAFVSHYLNIPYHLLMDASLYPMTLIEDLFTVSYHLIRNFELAPYREGKLEDKIIAGIENGRI